MISKKNKALVAGVLAAGMAATSVAPSFASAATAQASENNANQAYSTMFESLYDDVITNGQANGYLSSQNNGGDSFGIPYHAVETLVVEAPDYGHETTSEAMSYIVWMAAMHDALAEAGAISGSTGELAKAWTTMEAMIPGCSVASGRMTDVLYKTLWEQDRLKSDPAAEGDEPSDYPVAGYGGEAVNPLFNTFKSAYGSDNGYYLMNWLADVDDWYGFNGNGKFCFINTFQRGTQESCFETVPQPCLEELKYGMTSTPNTGIKGIFNGVGSVPKQYAFTNAPDAEDRAIQAVYFANQWNAGSPTISALAGKMGDQCRNDMFDKYYKPIAKGTSSSTEQNQGQLGALGGQHYLMSWYTAWGGALGGSDKSQYNWAWQIGCSHSHQFYQNPLAAFALLEDSDIKGGMKSTGAETDYKESFKRQIEMYLWLQSATGPIAGGCTNSYNGRYETYPSNLPTFYDMVYVAHPVYSDPGSNHWIGNQVWSIQRLAELYYYLKSGKATDPTGQTYGGLKLEDALKAILERWIDWFEQNTHFDWTAPDGTEYTYCIPSTLNWGANDKDSTDPNCVPDSWTGTYDPNGNQKLVPSIEGYGQGDVGCVSSLCNTLIYYAAANNVDASCSTAAAEATNTTVAEKGLRLANKLLTAQYNQGRDDIGIAFKDHNGSLSRVFTQKVYIPSEYKGTMPDGSALESGATFSSIRKSYEDDAMYQDAKNYYNGVGTDNNGDGKVDINDYEFTLHRFWHAGDALMAYGAMALLYPDVTPDSDEDGLWGDANHDGEVTVADPTLIMQFLSNADEFSIDSYGKQWGDVNANGDGITASDALAIQKYLAGTLAELPEA